MQIDLNEIGMHIDAQFDKSAKPGKQVSRDVAETVLLQPAGREPVDCTPR